MTAVGHHAAPPIGREHWDAFEVPEPYRAEIVRGELLVTPPASVHQGFVRTELVTLLDPQLPPRLRLAMFVEWRADEGDAVSMALQPDLVVLDREDITVDGPLSVTPTLVLALRRATDKNRLERFPMSRIEGKRFDYAEHGLRDYVEVDLSEDAPALIRYERQNGALIEVDRKSGEEALVSQRPFPYSLTPYDLIA